VRRHVDVGGARQGREAARAGDHHRRARRGAAGRPALMADFVPGYEASAWVGFGAPKATPEPIIDLLNRQVNAGLADPMIKAAIARLGGTTLTLSPAEFGKLFADDTAKWGKVIRAANIKAD